MKGKILLVIGLLLVGIQLIAQIKRPFKVVYPSSTLLSGYTYDDLTYYQAFDVIVNSSNVWNIPSPSSGGYAQSLPKFVLNSSRVMLYTANTKGIEFGLQSSGGNVFNAKQMNLNINVSGSVTVEWYNGGNNSEVLPTQPVAGQYIGYQRLSLSSSNISNVRITILNSLGVEVYGKTYAVEYLDDSNAVFQYFINPDATYKISYPQYK